MNLSELSTSVLRTRMLTNGSQRGAIAREVGYGRMSIERARPKLATLLAEAEEMRAEAIKRNLFSSGKYKPFTRPDWLDQKGDH